MGEAATEERTIEQRLEALEQKSSGWIPFWESPWARQASLDILREQLACSDTMHDVHDSLLVELLQRAFSIGELRRLLADEPRRPSQSPQTADIVEAAIESYPSRRRWPRRLATAAALIGAGALIGAWCAGALQPKPDFSAYGTLVSSPPAHR